MTFEEAAQTLLEGIQMVKCSTCDGSGIVPANAAQPSVDGQSATTWCRACKGARAVFDETWLEAWKIVNAGDMTGIEHARLIGVKKFWDSRRPKPPPPLSPLQGLVNRLRQQRPKKKGTLKV